MNAVEREYRVAIVSRDILVEALKRDPSTLTKRRLKQADFDTMRDNLGSTYLIRLFAESETGLMDYWRNGLNKKPSARVYDTINSVSSNRVVPNDERSNVHLVRKYRNKLVHEEDSEAETVDLGVARKFLCMFFGRLPEDW